jgi:hypothetical protein
MPGVVATWETEIRSITVQGQRGQMVQKIPFPKMMRAKWTEGVAHMIKHLHCKLKALISKFSPIKKQTKTKN